MQTAVFDAVDSAVNALEKETLSEDGLRACLAFLQLVCKEDGVPVVAQAQGGVQIALPRLIALPTLHLPVDVVLRRFCIHMALPFYSHASPTSARGRVHVSMMA